MAIIKCKNCGGDMALSADKTFGTCDSCGSVMTLPKVSDEQRAAAFNRGNHFRRTGEFDKALAVYEHLVTEDDTDAEAHWCAALCRFGIEYVEDPVSFEWLPTCHRASFDSFLEDVDYLAALEYSDGVTKRQYQREAAKISEVQKGILATSQSAEPFDVFICYKETDESGQRTRDSLMAQDIYYQLTEQGRRVFFARITLEDVVGAKYEPYIFAALHSAKVMVAIGTSAANFNAVWVKNEWSRFLALMKKDRSRLLLPCYRDMDPYDLPEALSVLQSYDMAKIGFIQDLVRGANKVLDAGKKEPPVVKETVIVQNAGTGPSGNAEALLQRGWLTLEDGEWDKADSFFEQVLNINPETAKAYVGKLCAELHEKNIERLDECAEPFDGKSNYQKAMRFGDEALKKNLKGFIQAINERNEQNRLAGLYNKAVSIMQGASSEQQFKEATAIFHSIPEYSDATEKEALCLKNAEETRLSGIYSKAFKAKQGANSEQQFKEAAAIFRTIPKYRDAAEQEALCLKQAERMAKEKRIADMKKAEAERIAKAKEKKIAIVLSVAAAVIVAVSILTKTSIVPGEKYKDAMALMDAEEYYAAFVAFGKLGNYKDARERSFELWSEVAQRDTVSARDSHTIGLKADGTVVAAGWDQDNQCDVADWTDIIAISAGGSHTAGLKADGTVVAAGSNYYGQCDVSDWTDIVAIAAGGYHTVGLKADGTVVVVGHNGNNRCAISGWSDIVAISAGAAHTVGLKADGTVVTEGNNSFGQRKVSGWTNIIAIAAGGYHTVGLKADGSVVATGSGYSGKLNVSDWTDIVSISAGGDHTVGLKADGTVVAVGDNSDGQCNISGWENIVALSAGFDYTVGLKADGTVVAIGVNSDGQCNVSGWRGIKVPER